MLTTLIDVIAQSVSLEEQDIELCRTYFEPISLVKNSVVEHQHKTPKYLYFIGSGYMRLFYLDESGDEVTTNLSSPRSFITPFLSFIHEVAAQESVECVTDCEVLRISKPDLAYLISQSSSFQAFSLLIFEQAIAATEKRANELATLRAEDRYQTLLDNRPSILQHVPIRHIASYLGIKPESLSRIRRNLTN